MSKYERVRATIAGEPVDRPAVALWRHWPGDDQRAEDFAAAHLHWQQTFDFDLIKLTPSSAYCLQDWGINTCWSGGDEGTRAYRSTVIDSPEDWYRLPELDPASDYLATVRQGAKLVCQAIGDDVPIIMTIFSPLAQAKNLAGANLLPHLRHHPEAVLAGFETISASILRYLGALKATGIDGVFYAAQLADASRLSREEYQHFGKPFDLQILEATGDFWFNMLHIHGHDVYFDLFTDYPVQAVNWHDRESGPSLAEGAKQFSGAVSGGLNRWTVQTGSPEDVRSEAADAISQTRGRRLILSTGCVAMTNSPLSNLRAARESVEISQD
ncbi:MAG: uroporphyrinogen decarboxylase family protein [Chloroflexota bacterium]|nr:uroporphyrinogen decarboxylase family protein [Chloroflexota bacterium]